MLKEHSRKTTKTLKDKNFKKLTNIIETGEKNLENTLPKDDKNFQLNCPNFFGGKGDKYVKKIKNK